MPEKKDNTTTLVAVGAAAMAGLGIFLAIKAGRKPEVYPGDVVLAKFVFDYSGTGGDYVIQVRLGTISLLFHTFLAPSVGGMVWTKGITLPEPGHYSEELECPIPLGEKPHTWDAEAQIKTPGMDLRHFIVNKIIANAVKVVAR